MSLTRSTFYLWLFFLVPLFYYFSLPLFSPDVDIWLAQGLAILKFKTLTPPETHLIGETLPMIYPTWGAAILYAALEKIFHPWGREFISLFHKLVLLLILAIFYFKTLRPLKNRWTGKNIFLILLSFYGFSYLFVDRPALLALVPFLLFFYILEDDQAWNFKKYSLLFFLTVLWINIHGSAILVLPMVFWHLLLEPFFRKKPYLILSGLLLLALMVNPFTWQIYSYTWQTASLSTARAISEWLSPLRFYSPANDLAYFLWLGLLGFFLFQKKRWAFFKSSAFPLTLLGLTAERHIVWAFLLIIPCWLENVPTSNESKGEGKQWINWTVVLSLLFGIILLNPFCRFEFIQNFSFSKTGRYSLQAQYPSQSLSFIKRCQLNGPVMNSLELGGWLELQAENKIFFDARNIIFPEKSFVDFRDVISGQKDWEDILQSYSIDLLLLTKADAVQLEKRLDEKSAWKILVNEPRYTLIGRKSVSSQCLKN